MEQTLTLETLPKAFANLTVEVSEIKKLLLEKQEQPTTETPEEFLTIQEASSFLSLTVPTMYSKVSKGELPFMKRSKRLYFSRTELMEYIKEGKRKTNAEIEQDAEAYLLGKKKGLKQ